MKKKHVIIPVFVPHKGCPHECIFCNQKRISGQIEEVTAEKISSTVESYLLKAPRGAFIEIAFYGGSFTGIKKEEQFSLLEVAYNYLKDGKVNSIRLSTRPDYINEEILEYLKEYNVGTIELGAQSFDEDVLYLSCRGHSADDIITSSLLIKQYGFNLGIQTMIGLPGDSREKDIYTAEKTIALKPEIVRIYPTLVIRGTYLEELYKKSEYVPLNLEEAVEICSELLEMYKSNGINVIRIGLQPTENISMDGDVIAGPFHPAFRQLVESRAILKKIENVIVREKFEGKNELIIRTGAKNVSYVVGQKRGNINHLRNSLGFKKVMLNVDKDLDDEIFIYKSDGNCWVEV
ncbi:MAG TPA: radical SAM protein [Clostridiaceae bacterium]|nr:radical SAM protein [Clostridiaceae bacterium]